MTPCLPYVIYNPYLFINLRYLDAYPEDGGHWIGKNYVFDKRFSHGAAHPKEGEDIISTCVHCAKPWHRYNAQKCCIKCKMEVTKTAN